MGTPHTYRLGAALGRARAAFIAATGQPMTTSDLAALLYLTTGYCSHFSSIYDLGRALDGIEMGILWPFAAGEDRGFIIACAHALCVAGIILEQDLLYELSTAAADDFMNP